MINKDEFPILIQISEYADLIYLNQLSDDIFEVCWTMKDKRYYHFQFPRIQISGFNIPESELNDAAPPISSIIEIEKLKNSRVAPQEGHLFALVKLQQ